MKRHIPGLHEADPLPMRPDPRRRRSWFASSEPSIVGTVRSPIISLRFVDPRAQDLAGHSITGRLYCTPEPLWKLNWFLRDFGYDSELLGRDEVDERAWSACTAWSRSARSSATAVPC